MRLTNSLTLPALCFTAQLAAAASAQVYIHDSQAEPRTPAQSTDLDPVTARLVLAQRASVEEYHGSDLSRNEVINAINEYGVRTPLFTTTDSPRKAFLLLETDTNTQASLASYTSFNIAPAPALSATRGLFLDLARQSDPKAFSHLSDESLLELLKDSKTTSTYGDMFYITRSISDFQDLFTRLAKTEKWSITALIPSSHDLSSKREGQFQWGTYEMPGVDAPLKRRQQKEDVLTEVQSAATVESFTAPVAAFANNTTPLRGILPACFSTLSVCESATRNCTGHGRCTRKYHDATATEAGIDCYTCACTATSNDGRTTNWGGPACQKKDISVQFWLIALFTVGMIFLVGFAIGSVWEMGQQELPSVIGAGVSGPTARK